MSLTITRVETRQLIAELATLTGVAPELAVLDARRRLDEVKREQDVEARLAEVKRIAADFRRDLTDEDIKAIRNVDDELYDAFGLPADDFTDAGVPRVDLDPAWNPELPIALLRPCEAPGPYRYPSGHLPSGQSRLLRPLRGKK